jgi:SAM-dependent methyltransferase
MYIPKSEIEKVIGPTDKVLDIGSWNDVFPRADVVIDVNPFETRKNFHPDQGEHFSKATWLLADVNKAETWANFRAKEFDFVICSHLLEDIRDPLFVCEQLIRVAKRGYIEAPTRYRECARAAAADTVSGYDHHRWLVEVVDGSLTFTAKLHWAHTVDYLTEGRRHYLGFHNFHYFGVFWEDSFHFHERCPKGEILEGANLLYLFNRLDLASLQAMGRLGPDSGLTPRGSILWVDQFALPIEGAGRDVMESYIERYRAACAIPKHLVVGLEAKIVQLKRGLSSLLISTSLRATARFRRMATWFQR